MALQRPVALIRKRNYGLITQKFDGSFSWEPSGWLRSDGKVMLGRQSRFRRASYRSHLHLGIDYSVPSGSPVRAVKDGVIVAQGRYGYTGEYYLLLRIKRNWRRQFVAFYTHLQPHSFTRRVGAKVNRGDILARSGSSGWSTGPHLHFELRRGSRWASPTFVNTFRWMRFDPQPFIDGATTLERFM